MKLYQKPKANGISSGQPRWEADSLRLLALRMVRSFLLVFPSAGTSVPVQNCHQS